MADVLPFPSRARPRPVDDGSVMTAAELLAWHHDNHRPRQTREEFEAELAEWNARVDAAAAAYRARREGDVA